MEATKQWRGLEGQTSESHRDSAQISSEEREHCEGVRWCSKGEDEVGKKRDRGIIYMALKDRSGGNEQCRHGESTLFTGSRCGESIRNVVLYARIIRTRSRIPYPSGQ